MMQMQVETNLTIGDDNWSELLKNITEFSFTAPNGTYMVCRQKGDGIWYAKRSIVSDEIALGKSHEIRKEKLLSACKVLDERRYRKDV